MNIHCVPKKETYIILNMLYSFKSIAVKFSTSNQSIKSNLIVSSGHQDIAD